MNERRRSGQTAASGPLCAVVLATALLACGEGPGSSDADAGGDANDAGPALSPADIPWLAEGMPAIAAPMLTPCPEGWHEVVEEAPEGGTPVVTCDPYGTDAGGTDPDACPAGSAHFVGEAECAPVGAPCPTGVFPEGLPAEADVLYVLSSAPPGGDGSQGSPLSTITAAMNMASASVIIAIGKGDYDEALRLRRGVTLWGACAAETRVTASSPGLLAQGIITASAADTHLVNLRIGPASLPGLVAFGEGTSVSVDGVVIHQAQRFGLRVLRGARVYGQRLVVSNTRPDGAGSDGLGMAASYEAKVELAWVVVSESASLGVSASGEGTSVSLSDVAVRDGQSDVGVQAQSAATLTLSRALLSRNHELGLLARGEGTSVALSDVVVRDTLAGPSDGTRGRGIVVLLGAEATITRALFSSNREVSVLVDGVGTLVTLSDVVIGDTLARQSDGTGGMGMSIQVGAAARVNRGLLFRSREAAVSVLGEDTSVTLTDVVIRDTLSQEPTGLNGRGLNVQSGAAADVERALFVHNRDVGVHASGTDTRLSLRDVVIRDTQPQKSDDGAGRGLNIQSGATATVDRALLSHNREFGVLAMDPGTTAQLSDIVVTQTDEQACSETSCADGPFGVGLAGEVSARLEATRFEVQDSALCGVLVAHDGQVDLSVGQVSGSQIGVCLQVDGYSISRLTDRVDYAGNGTNLDATNLPVPAPASALGGAR